MKLTLIKEIQELNPWLQNSAAQIMQKDYIPRIQSEMLLDPEWDNLALMLLGPRQAGKTTIGKFISHSIIHSGRFKQLLYLNCDLKLIREWLTGIAFIDDISKSLHLKNYILFIDEIQRLENPGLLVKAIIDLKLPIKVIVSGSSHLEIKSKVQEHLTGRHIEALILPLSWEELRTDEQIESRIIFGCYPQIIKTQKKEFVLQQLYKTYFSKDIIEILKISRADTMERLVTLLAHSNGQLANHEQFAADCQVSSHIIKQYIDILQKTFIIDKVTPFVGNKRKELTSQPIYYFIDNGFRNQSLFNFNQLSSRSDLGLLIESTVFQEILKFKLQHFKSFKIHYWRTKGGAEVDFVLYQNQETIIPIEVKYTRFTQFKLSRSYRSFIEAYQPKIAILITKDFLAQQTVGNTEVYCFPLQLLKKSFDLLKTIL